MKKILFLPLIFILILSALSLAEESHEISKEDGQDKNKEKIEKESELIDFKAIKDVLKNDRLDTNAEKKIVDAKKASDEKVQKALARFNIN
ncbi:MAG: hypothetical protein WCG27_02040, partial [Pseudomonadota bacterium]